MTLQRRRELSNLTKAELIDWAIQVESGLNQAQYALNAFRQRVDPYDGEQTDNGGWEDH